MAGWWVNNVVGSNGNSGQSAGAPWRDVAYAVGNAQVNPGDSIIVVNAGQPYRENITLGRTGLAGNPITLRADDRWNPPTIRPDTNSFNLARDYWIIRDFIIRDAPATCLVAGDGATTIDGLVLRRLIIAHNADTGFGARNTDSMEIDSCMFLDNRTRVTQNGSLGIYVSTRMSNAWIHDCRFLDNGADGIQTAASNVNGVIERCEFRILRPYFSRAWHDFCDSVGENGLDFKARTVATLFVKRCVFGGFYEWSACQDIGGSSNGAGVVVHVDSTDITCDQMRVYDCGAGLNISQGGGVGRNARITYRNAILHNPNTTQPGSLRRGVSVTYCDDVVIEHVSVIGMATPLALGPQVKVLRVQNNLFQDGTPSRSGAGVTGEANVKNNVWNTVSVPTQWQNTNPSVPNPNLDAFHAPNAGSGLLNAGLNLAVATDAAGVVRDATPAVGALEQRPIPSDANLLWLDGDWMFWDGAFDSVTDPNSELLETPLPDSIDVMGFGVKVSGTSARYGQKAFADSRVVRLNVTIQPHLFSMGEGDAFAFVTVRDLTQNRGTLELRYSNGSFYVRAKIDDDAAVSHWAGVEAGFVIARTAQTVQVQWKTASAPGANDGHVALWINGVLAGADVNIDNDTFTLSALRIGAVTGIDATTGHAEEYFGTFYLADVRATDIETTVGGGWGGIASFPNSVVAFTRQQDGVSAIDAADVNTLYDEVEAIERALLGVDPLPASMADGVSPYLQAPELRAFWPGSSVNESGALIDISGNDRTLTNVGGATRGVYSSVTPYWEFNGTTQWYSRADEAGMDITGALTFGGWVWRDVDGSFERLAAKYGGAGQRSYVLYHNVDRWTFNLTSDGTNQIAAASGAGSSVIGRWEFVVARFTPSTEMAVFVNGVKAVNTSGIPATIHNSTAEFRLGANGDASNSNKLDGRETQVFVAAAAWSDALIGSIFNRTRDLFGV